MDRHTDRLAGPGQVGFFKFVAVPMYEAFAEVFHDAGHPLLHYCKANMQAWADMGEAEKKAEAGPAGLLTSSNALCTLVS